MAQPKRGAGRGRPPVAATAAALLTAALGLAGCGGPAAPGSPEPRPAPDGLPPVPSVDGRLHLRISYPRDGLELETRGDNFVFGSAGSGRALVWVDGREVEVQPNGGFLAFLPVPPEGVYRVRATLDGETQTVTVPVLLPPAPPEPDGRAVIVAGSIYPAGARVALPGERIDVGLTGTAGGRAWLELGDDRVPLLPAPVAAGGTGEFEVTPAVEADSPDLMAYRGFFTARPVLSRDGRVPWPTLASAPAAPVQGTVVLAVAGDTVRRPLPLNLLLADPAHPRVGVGRDLDPPARNGDGRVVARPGPGGGPYHYVWANGVELELDGEWNGAYRVRLTDVLHAWTPKADVQLQTPGTAPPASRVATVRLAPAGDHIDVHLALDRRLPYRVEEGERSLSIVVYGALSRVNFLQHGALDPYIDRAEWSQPDDRRFRLDVWLNGRPWGYDTFWGAGHDLVLRVRRPPALDPAEPLRGLTIGVDPGHGGEDRETMGPTGLTEADANLGVALALRDLLRARGARVVMSRMSDTTYSLVERTRRAREADVDVWISVHNNALPDGLDPWANNGTSVYYNHPAAAGLARSVEAALVDALAQRDLGVGRADLHQARFTWAPAILTESLFMMIPRHEAFLRTDAGRRRIAEAHVRGLEAWLRQVAEEQARERVPAPAPDPHEPRG